MRSSCILFAAAVYLVTAWQSAAELSATLKHTLRESANPFQTNTQEGYSVAVDGNLTVVGVPFANGTAGRSGLARVYDNVTGAILYTLRVPYAGQDSFFGSSVAISGSRVVLGSDSNGGGSAAVFDLTSGSPEIPVATLYNPDVFGRRFGQQVAISGWLVAVSGNSQSIAPYDDKVFIFDLTHPDPNPPVFTIVNPVSNTGFGSSIALAGNQLVVGAEKVKSPFGANNSGAVYVFDLGSGSRGTPVYTMTNPNAVDDAFFGHAVRISGNRIVVGAYENQGYGGAYVYNLSGGTPTVAEFTMRNPTPGIADRFGYSVAISGTRVLVGAYRDTTGATSSGSAYLYDISGPKPAPLLATISNPTPAISDHFGISVCMTGDKVIIGAELDDTVATDSGSVYVYDASSTPILGPSLQFAAGTSAATSYFGRQVAISGSLIAESDYFGRLRAYDLASGTPTKAIFDQNLGGIFLLSGTKLVVAINGGTYPGAVRIYDLAGANRSTPIMTLDNPTGNSADGFGSAVGMFGNVLVVGASGFDGVVVDSGRAYVYDLASTAPRVPILILENPGGSNPPLYFGYAVAMHDARFAISALGANVSPPTPTPGRVYVYNYRSVTPEIPVFTLGHPDPDANQGFGQSLSMDGERCAVGAPGSSNYGGAFLYDFKSANPASPLLSLRSTESNYYYFGASVALSGNQLVVGEVLGSSDQYYGRVRLYDLSLGDPTIAAVTLSDPNGTRAAFGRRVAMDRNTLVVGAPEDDGISWNNGAVFVYRPVDDDADDDGLLDLWEEAHYGSTSLYSANDDADGDGLNELMEMAFDRDLAAPPGATSPTPVVEGGYLTLTVSKRAGIKYTVQSSAISSSESFSTSETTILNDSPGVLKVRDNVPVSASAARFMRVLVSPNP